MKLSFVAADVNLTSEGTPSLACMFVWTLMPPFFFPVFGWPPTPWKSRLENRVTVVESMICSLFIQLDDGFFRLSEESSSLYLAYRLRYIFSKMASDLLALASDRVRLSGIMLMPRWASFRASGNIESVISRRESNLFMTA